MVLTLIGFVVIGPLLAGGVVRVLGAVLLRAFGPVGRMAERNALRNPRRTGATGAALMIGLALVACLSVVGSSMVASATDELDKSVGADFIVQSDNGQPITPQAEKAMQATAGPGARHRATRTSRPTSPPPDGKTLETTDITAADPTYADRPARARPSPASSPTPTAGRHVGRTRTSPRTTSVKLGDRSDRRLQGRRAPPS